MTATRDRSLSAVALETVGWPLLWGTLACAGFYYLIHNKIIDSPMLVRYFAGHPVEYMEAALFFIGLCALLFKAASVSRQLGSLHSIELPPRPEGGQAVAESAGMLRALRELPRYVRCGILGRRLEAGLEYVNRKGTALGLDQELRNLSDLEACKAQEDYALARMIIWAIPMLGFLGTVIGITMALADLSPEVLVTNPERAMEGLLAGLAIAFDTTAIALVLSIVLMFCQYLTTRVDASLLEAVDDRVAQELVGRFEELGTASDPTLAIVKQLMDKVSRSTEDLVDRQGELWSETITSAHVAWKQMMNSAAPQLTERVAESLAQCVQDHADRIAATEVDAADRAERRWQQLREALTENARTMQLQQSELVKQGDALLRLLEQSKSLSQLQSTLQNNLSSLSTINHLQETLTGLDHSIDVLNSRLGAAADHSRRNHVVTREGGRRAA